MQNVFLENAQILKKINFPVTTLPIIIIISALLNFAIVFSLYFIFLLLLGSWPGWVVVAIIPTLVIQTILAVGIGSILGVMNVFFRDISQFFNIFIQFWFWFTPIIYTINALPEVIKIFIKLNPMYPPTAAYQKIFYAKEWPDFTTLLYPALLGVALCVLGGFLFWRCRAEIMDEL
jgi:lipopolysaccharide transport system permease protein